MFSVQLQPTLQEDPSRDIHGSYDWTYVLDAEFQYYQFSSWNYQIKHVYFITNYTLTKIIRAVCLFLWYIFKNMKNH
jgi:hypothetical protein